VQDKLAKTPEEYIAALPENRRASIAAVRSVVRKHLPKGYAEFVNFGMLNYGIPLARMPKTYNGQPLCYVALAGQKNYCSLYLMSVYGDKKHEAKLRDAFKTAGKKLDMGKSCIRFQTQDDLPLDAVGQIISSIPSEQWIEIFEASRKKKRR
jgi:uncharacterized protein YdhG (YjbR/CyaY superfamily)